MVKRFVYKEQYKNRGCYAEIAFEVEFYEGAKNEIQIKYLAESNWELMCCAGLNLFYGYFIKFKTGRLIVIVHEIKWLPVDTNQIVVLFASVKALCDALNIENKNLRFDSAAETFNFPDFRSVRNGSVIN